MCFVYTSYSQPHIVRVCVYVCVSVYTVEYESGKCFICEEKKFKKIDLLDQNRKGLRPRGGSATAGGGLQHG